MNRCSICWNNLTKKNIHSTKCKHEFHRCCIFKWLQHVDKHSIRYGDNGVLQGTCPICRKEISMIALSITNKRDFNFKLSCFTFLPLIFGKGLGYKIHPNK